MAEEGANGTKMMLHLLGECQCRVYQPSNALAERVVQALDVIGAAGFFRDGCVPRCGHHTVVDDLLVRIECGLLPIQSWKVRPEWLGTFATAIAHVQGNDLAGAPVKCEPGFSCWAISASSAPKRHRR